MKAHQRERPTLDPLSVSVSVSVSVCQREIPTLDLPSVSVCRRGTPLPELPALPMPAQDRHGFLPGSAKQEVTPHLRQRQTPLLPRVGPRPRHHPRKIPPHHYQHHLLVDGVRLLPELAREKHHLYQHPPALTEPDELETVKRCLLPPVVAALVVVADMFPPAPGVAWTPAATDRCYYYSCSGELLWACGIGFSLFSVVLSW